MIFCQKSMYTDYCVMKYNYNSVYILIFFLILIFIALYDVNGLIKGLGIQHNPEHMTSIVGFP